MNTELSTATALRELIAIQNRYLNGLTTADEFTHQAIPLIEELKLNSLIFEEPK
jgi:hypothetical protein